MTKHDMVQVTIDNVDLRIEMRTETGRRRLFQIGLTAYELSGLCKLGTGIQNDMHSYLTR